MATPKTLAIIFALAASGFICAPAPSHSQNPPPANDNYPPRPNLTIGGGTWQMLGHRDFCRRLPEECVPNPDGRARMVIGDHTAMRMLDQVNRKYNRGITYKYDREQYGLEEYWAYPDSGYGDCEDYALAKRRELIARGWPPSSLLIAIARTETNDVHAVLVARTTRADYILDNRHRDVKAWYELPYKWQQIQSPHHSGRWRDLKNEYNRIPKVG